MCVQINNFAWPYPCNLFSKWSDSLRLNYLLLLIGIRYANHFGVKMFLRYWMICWIWNVCFSYLPQTDSLACIGSLFHFKATSGWVIIRAQWLLIMTRTCDVMSIKSSAFSLKRQTSIRTAPRTQVSINLCNMIFMSVLIKILSQG